MTQTQAYEQAARDGKIAMQPQTANAFAAIARMREAVTAVYEAIASIYGEDNDEISERIFDAYSGLHEEALILLAQHVIYNSMAYTNFNGL